MGHAVYTLLGDDDRQVQGSSRVTDASRVGYSTSGLRSMRAWGVTDNQTS